MTKITLKTVLMLGVLSVLIVSVAGCTSSTNSNQAASSASQATSSATKTTATTASTTKKATATQSPVSSKQPSVAGDLKGTPSAPPATGTIQTVIFNEGIPVDVQKGDAFGALFAIIADGRPICTDGLTVNVYVDSTYVGHATPILVSGRCSLDMLYQFPTNSLTIGLHTVTLSFIGNSQYKPSLTTLGANIVVPYTPTPTATPASFPTLPPEPTARPTSTPTTRPQSVSWSVRL